METEQQQHSEASTLEETGHADGHTAMTRREALAVVGRHAVYTAPAVLAILSATKSKSAYAFSRG